MWLSLFNVGYVKCKIQSRIDNDGIRSETDARHTADSVVIKN